MNLYHSPICRYEKFEGKPFSINDAEYVVFHSPYNKVFSDGNKMLEKPYVLANFGNLEIMPVFYFHSLYKRALPDWCTTIS